MKRLVTHLPLLTLLLALCSQANAISTFNVLGSETQTEFSLLFVVSDATGTALSSKAWSTASKYEHIDTAAMLNMLYWDVTFQYDAATTSIHIDAFHKIDPHTSAADAGGKFIWNAARPAAVNPVGATGALRGSIEFQDYKEHDDSLGKHSDAYVASMAYTVNIGEPPHFAVRKDVLTVEVTGKHRPQPVPDFAPSAILLLLGLLSVFGLTSKSGLR